ncbi:hypothetical protein H0H92_000626, partial [Tricholoma furcatifolium]
TSKLFHRLRSKYLALFGNMSKSDLSYIFWNGLRVLCHIAFLGIPNFYMTRVHHVFSEVDHVEKLALEKIVVRLGDLGQGEVDSVATQVQLQNGNAEQPPCISDNEFYHLDEDTVSNLKERWESFIDKCMREWEGSNIITVLLLSKVNAVEKTTSSATHGLHSLCPLTGYAGA